MSKNTQQVIGNKNSLLILSEASDFFTLLEKSREKCMKEKVK